MINAWRRGGDVVGIIVHSLARAQLAQRGCSVSRAGHSAAQVRTVVGLVDVEPVLVMVCQTLANELFAAVRDGRLGRELDLACV